MRWKELNEDSVTAPIGVDDPLFEMANLEPAQTGIQGTIYISTQQAGHGPRVKYFAGRPGNNQPSMSISVAPQPEVVVSNLSTRVSNKMAPIVQAWVMLNHTKLRDFWFKGNTWYKSEVDAFIAGLSKWTPDAVASVEQPAPQPIQPTKNPKRK